MVKFGTLLHVLTSVGAGLAQMRLKVEGEQPHARIWSSNGTFIPLSIKGSLGGD